MDSDAEQMLNMLENECNNRLHDLKFIDDTLYKEIGGYLNKKQTNTHTEYISDIDYNFNLSNTNVDLKSLTAKLKKAWERQKPFTMLLYGVSGSGKSYYAKYLAQELHLKFLKKKASDLVSKLVGETEKNIRDAFKEAEELGAILVIDEADSMLYDRSQARQDFQVATVNEMLVQMETFKYPFICTTNLIDKIDTASFRRFIFKIKFDYLPENKVKNCIKYFFNKSTTSKQLNKYKCTTAGDFFNIQRKLDILNDNINTISTKDILNSLQEELQLKPDYKENIKNSIGFKN